MSKQDYQVLVLGLDGATFDLMLPWIDQGRLPVLGGLLGRGAWSPLESTIPPHTPCAWSSFITGKNPGKHGVFEFSEPVSGTYEFRFTNSASRHGESLWGNLSAAGKRVGVVNVPMTYPPEEVNGYLISGLDTPHEYSRFMHPANIREDLDDAAIRYRIDLQHMGNMRSDERRRAMLKDLNDMETQRTKAFQLLSERYPADFRMLVYTATDRVSHHFWHYMDESHDKFDNARADEFGDAICRVYEHIDGLIGQLLEAIDDRTIVMLMSDHGFGPTSNVRLQLNGALAQSGLLSFAREGKGGRTMRRLAGAADKLLRSTLTPGMKHFLAGMFPKLRAKFESMDEARIDWPKTKAYTNEAFRTCPAIWLNRESNRPDGNVGENEDEVNQVLSEVEDALLELRDPTTGNPVVSKVYRGKDIYHGPSMHKAPDLVPSWWEDAFLLEQSSPDDEAVVRRCDKVVEGGVEFTGGHKLNGIFAMAGGPVKQGHCFDTAKIIDVAPTVLYLMGQPIPGDMDGRPLTEGLDPDFVAKHPPKFTGDVDGDQDTRPPEEDTFTEEESDLIAKRLQSLGYI